jgi:hypothetical protein
MSWAIVEAMRGLGTPFRRQPRRLTREEAIEHARGAFKDHRGPCADEMRRLDREEERRSEERKFGPDPR